MMISQMTRKAKKLQSWIKKQFPDKEANGLNATGYRNECGFITVEFMDHDYGIWVILCTGHEDRVRLNIGTFTSIRQVKRLLKGLKGGE